ncbi:alpha/beta hydrolase [Nonomuraea sp. NBC_01738]|uniref:alpha/beta fold hydrolase n=1 Tax=Nonomuraea sp. NBC_01738 TaxID=2976003 RepID=UPI002E121D6D|nr:alpha/beta hydrolase [Nonomuraea sp. NBC_01738]
MPYLPVPGATLYYDVRGTGPTLLISQSGEGDADRTVDLVNHLATDHTVITYDRRGLSRSALADPERGATMHDHAEDARHLLEALTDTPALMLGCSLGAVIGLHLAARRPGLLSTLIAHEPVAPTLLPPAERTHHTAELAEIQTTYQQHGLTEAFKSIAQVLGIDPTNPGAEPGRTPQPMTPQRVRNFAYFIENDFTAVIDDVLPTQPLTATTTRIIPAAGRTTPAEVFDRRCADELSVLTGEPVAMFPGGHNGNTTHPRAYAARVRETFHAAGALAAE